MVGIYKIYTEYIQKVPDFEVFLQCDTSNTSKKTTIKKKSKGIEKVKLSRNALFH